MVIDRFPKFFEIKEENFFLTKNFGLRFDSACSFLRHLENRQRGEMSLSLEKQNDRLCGLHRLLLENHRTCILHLKLNSSVIRAGAVLSNLDKCGNLRIEPRIELRRVFVVRRGIADQQQGGNAKITFAKWSSHQIDLSSLKFESILKWRKIKVLIKTSSF